MDHEIEFLKTLLGWKKPKILGGITRKGHAKPDFMLYFDAGDTISTPNLVANRIADLLPSFERFKIDEIRQGHCIRGACVLIYSPMKSFLSYKHEARPTFSNTKGLKLTTGEEDSQFSMKSMRQILMFHQTPDAADMYKRHDHPKHRLFGDLM